MSEANIDKIVKLKKLISVEGIGPGKIFSLLNKFHNLDNILTADFKRLISVNGINQNLANKILKSVNNSDNIKQSVEIELEKLDKLKGRIITYWDAEYPELLKNIYFPPLILYVLGNFESQDKYCIAIVGSRQPTNYGKEQTEKFSGGLAEQGITIASGLARGIDSIAHKYALKNNGRTIAVIGSGLDVVYPPENKKLFEEIIEKGLVISEFKLGTKPDAQNFPRRNRIISGLSLGTIIIETKLNGGAIQTASYALEQNREVFAVPGNLGVKQSDGTNALIQKGEAKLVITTEDVLVELQLKLKPVVGKNIPKPVEDLNFFEQKIYNLLGKDPKHIDLITEEASLSTADCLVHLLTLEFKGAARQLPGKMFSLN